MEERRIKGVGLINSMEERRIKGVGLINSLLYRYSTNSYFTPKPHIIILNDYYSR